MSHEAPPPPSSTGPFGFRAVDATDIHSVADPTQQLGADADAMLSPYGGLISTYNSFGNMPVSIDSMSNLAVPRRFSTDSSTAHGYGSAFLPPQERALGIWDLPTGTPSTGPPPIPDFVPQSSNMPGMASGNPVTEFTKRRNWPAKTVENLEDLLQILDSNGRIRYVSASVDALTGFTPGDMFGRLLQDFIHPDDVEVFIAGLHESITSGNAFRLFYRLKKRDASWAVFEAVGHAHIAPASFAPNANSGSPFGQAVFLMTRPYPTKNAALIDSFLEHKIENERLKRRIAELRKEEEEEDEAAEDIEESPRTRHQNTGATGYTMPPPRPPASPKAFRSGGSLEGLAGNTTDSVRGNVTLYGGPTHADTIERLTGLKYREGERSRGLTTGNTNPVLTKGDAGIALPVDRDNRGSRTVERRKKLKTAEEYVCTDCGTLDSPEWRKGPSGPKTLCNACGLRWAKKEKKRSGSFS